MAASKLEGVISKRVDAPYTPGNRGLWVKVKMPDPVKRPIGLVNRVERFEETAEAAWRLRN